MKKWFLILVCLCFFAVRVQAEEELISMGDSCQAWLHYDKYIMDYFGFDSDYAQAIHAIMKVTYIKAILDYTATVYTYQIKNGVPEDYIYYLNYPFRVGQYMVEMDSMCNEGTDDGMSMVGVIAYANVKMKNN